MAPVPFLAAAAAVEQTGLPTARGVAVRAVGAEAREAVRAALPGWTVEAAGMDGWLKATPPADPPLSLARAWETCRRLLDDIQGVREAEPMLVLTVPAPRSTTDAEAFAANLSRSVGVDAFGLWGKGYDEATRERIVEASRDLDWHLDQLNIPAALDRWRDRRGVLPPGDGVVVGHVDTGYTEHPAILDRLIPPGKSFIEGLDGEPEEAAVDDRSRDDDRAGEDRDDLGPLAFPGHGTATASVIAGEHVGPAGIWGVAPGARLLPLRVSRSVIHLDFTHVADAIRYAADNDAHVVSMSLGGPFYSAYARDAIAYAHSRGVIVVSAAGNYFPTVMFPAAFPEVVGVAATHPLGEPWRFSGVGDVVDIAAPGEDVWVARWRRVDGELSPRGGYGTGTSHGTACVAGLAALWLSYWGRQTIADAYPGRPEYIPSAFQLLLRETADTGHDFVEKRLYGAGIANADALLAAELPSAEAVAAYRAEVAGQSVHRASVFTRVIGGIFAVDGAAPAGVDPEAALVAALLGDADSPLAPELLARLATDPAAIRFVARWQQDGTLLPLVDRLLRASGPIAAGGTAPFVAPAELELSPERRAALAQGALSPALRDALTAAREREAAKLARLHQGTLPPPRSADSAPAAGAPSAPSARMLRVFSFDPTLSTRLATAPIFQVTIPARWEPVEPGPVGEYLEVVDIDPASGCLYPPVDLDEPGILAQDGLAPSEGSPQFHQQMVYAVAMNTIHHFELALGRPIFWSPVRPWFKDQPEEALRWTPEAHEARRTAMAEGTPGPRLANRDRYVKRLRIHPHALREANAYYDPAKRALLFGYFPAPDDGTSTLYPGGLVFTCLSHDIVAHETTHALLDGMHPSFNIPTNPDVAAFHEAFADIVALFQHFTYPEVLRHQIAKTRGNLEADNLLAQLAQELGLATGRRSALRNAIGTFDDNNVFHRRKPNPRLLTATPEPHDRGGILVAAVFDAFLALYNRRIADLVRIATSGSGELPIGQLHPDLVNRLADEAAATAAEVLRICIRALDYVPPVDITFGEYLRALITADYELAPSERHETRIAFIEAFRRWGIYPRDVQVLSEESLRWHRPVDSPLLHTLKQLLVLAEQHAIRNPQTPFADAIAQAKIAEADPVLRARITSAVEQLHVVRVAKALQMWQPGADRATVFAEIIRAQAAMHRILALLLREYPDDPLFPGIRPDRPFSIANLRPARRVGPNGEFAVQMIFEIVQDADGDEPNPFRFRGGATVIVDMREWDVAYVVYKRLYAGAAGAAKADGAGADADAAFAPRKAMQERYMADHLGVDAGSPHAGGVAEDGLEDRWRDAGKACATKQRNRIAREPFALLHRGEL